MRVISTNIAKPVSIIRNGKEVKTGIYKTAVEFPIFLGKTAVRGDAVMDRKNHGGIDKACYLYSSDHYDFWKERFPNLDWSWGMFGENLTVEGLDESKINIGDTFQIGNATVQVSEPRRPCSTLGIRFGTQAIVKLFNNSSFPGIYVRIIKEGEVTTGDELIPVTNCKTPSIATVFSLFSNHTKNENLALKVLSIDPLSEDCKNAIRERYSL